MYNQENLFKQKKYLQLLSQSYTSIQAACTEIINLSAILNLPKGTEHFISDLHGEYEIFTHIVKNASGSIKRKIDTCFEDSISEQEKKLLSTIIYYPQEKLAYLKASGFCTKEWYTKTLMQLVLICRVVTSKYTRSKVRKTLSEDFIYIIDELLYTDNFEINKQEYFSKIINTIIDIDRADHFIIEISNLLQKLVVDRLHIIGDIYDRGFGAHLILEDLMRHNNVDFQWGNHDVVWMAASHGHTASIANVVRNSIRYNNFNSLEEGYGINVRPLAVFAMQQYADDECENFMPKILGENEHETSIDKKNALLTAKINKAITIIQLKLEGQIIKNRPEFNMQDRLLLDKINTELKTVVIDGKTYDVCDCKLPTVNENDVYALTAEEKSVMKQLKLSFMHSKLLQKHVNFLYKNGGIYKICNSNLLYHGCIPMNEDGSFTKFNSKNGQYYGKNLLSLSDKLCRSAQHATGEERDFGLDFMWYLWCGPVSPLNGKKKMTTFERTFIKDKSTWQEPKDPYYSHITLSKTADRILNEFGMNIDCSHIVNGHVPVNIKKGESPIKAGGKVLIIDGGIAKAYQEVTGISGYTLISNSYQLLISEHYPFKGVEQVIENDDDMHSKNILVEEYNRRMTIADTDVGEAITNKIYDLEQLVEAYKTGLIVQS